MKVSPQQLAAEAARTGFRPEILEKVAQLLHLLANLRSHPYLKDRFALKGGTALNLFMADVPRLSVDIDLNYIGSPKRETMLAERPLLERAVEAVCHREGFAMRRAPDPTEHAGGKWSLRYESASGQGGNIEIDVNYMFRIPLWPVKTMDSRAIGSWHAPRISVMDPHELAAGKLAALLSRHRARDVFDVSWLLRNPDLDPGKLRVAFVAYGAMNRRDWRNVSQQDVNLTAQDVARQLIPLLRDSSAGRQAGPAVYGEQLTQSCRQALTAVLPFTRAEQRFLDLLLDKGIIEPEHLTSDAALGERIARHPMLQWKALNVRGRESAS